MEIGVRVAKGVWPLTPLPHTTPYYTTHTYLRCGQLMRDVRSEQVGVEYLGRGWG